MSDRREQKSNRHSGHQHADHTFERAQQAPFRREDHIPISNGRIAAGRAVTRRFPGWKATPAIPTRPQQTHDPVQNDDGYRGLHDERCAAKHPYSLTLSRNTSYPNHERGGSATLQRERDQQENSGGASLLQQSHCPRSLLLMKTVTGLSLDSLIPPFGRLRRELRAIGYLEKVCHYLGRTEWTVKPRMWCSRKSTIATAIMMLHVTIQVFQFVRLRTLNGNTPGIVACKQFRLVFSGT